MAKQLTDFYPEVLIDVPNCPTPVVKNAILNALVDFCKRSRYWIIDLDAVDVVADTAVYNVVSNVTNTLVHELYRVKCFGIPLDPYTQDQLDADWPVFSRKYPNYNSVYTDPWDTYTTDQPRVFFQPTPTTVRLVGIPNKAETGGLVMSAAVYPGPSIANEIPADIFNEYREAIGFGAKARLFAQPRKDWSDANAAIAQYGLFNQQVEEAAAKRARDFIRDNKTTHRTRAHY